MRLSAAHLANSLVRLADLTFPATRVQVHRTRLAYIHLDNLLHFAKIDRDGRVDGYIAAYLPDEVALLFLEQGEPVTAVALMEQGREVLPIATALQRMRGELERSELAFCEAPREQLAWMYASCASPTDGRPVEDGKPAQLFKALQHEQYDGVLELISDGRVTYLRFEGGRFTQGHFCGRRAHETVPRFMERQFSPGADGTKPILSANVFAPLAVLPPQAPPAMIAGYHSLFWQIADAAEAQVQGEALRRAAKVRDGLSASHPALVALGDDREKEPDPMVVTPDELTEALSLWAYQLLEQLEVIAPGVAPTVLREATREHRFVLQKAGFYDRMTWPVTW